MYSSLLHFLRRTRAKSILRNFSGICTSQGTRRVFIYSSSLSPYLFLSRLSILHKSSYDGISIVIIPSRDFDGTIRNVSFVLKVYKSFSFDEISCRFPSSSCSLIHILRLPPGRCNFSLPQPLCHLSWRAMNRTGLCIREVVP